MSKRTTALFLLSLLAALLVAGCMQTGDDNEPSARRDTHQIPIAPGSGLEFKLYMRSGDPLEYSWSATDFVSFDFHGEEDGAPPEAFTSHKAGEARQDEGSLVAPFSGTHGWWWQNRGSQELKVTLHTDGVYAVVGFV